MIIDISAVLLNTGVSKQYTVRFEPTKFESRIGDYEVVNSEEFKVELVCPVKNKLQIKAHSSITLNIPCSRCLTDVETVVDYDIDNEVFLERMSDEEEEQDFVESHFLDVDKMLYPEILMNIPAKVLCKDDCLGICTVCGKNLNQGECGCDRFVPDPRMSAINDIFEKFNK